MNRGGDEKYQKVSGTDPWKDSQQGKRGYKVTCKVVNKPNRLKYTEHHDINTILLKSLFAGSEERPVFMEYTVPYHVHAAYGVLAPIRLRLT